MYTYETLVSTSLPASTLDRRLSGTVIITPVTNAMGTVGYKLTVPDYLKGKVSDDPYRTDYAARCAVRNAAEQLPSVI